MIINELIYKKIETVMYKFLVLCSLQLNTVWLSCEGVDPADSEFIGTVEYIPFQGFPGYYFPFLGVRNYLSPLVAVHFKNISSKCEL
jgi:hypothetical protein